MNLKSKKLELVELLMQTHDSNVLAKVEAALTGGETDWWDELSNAEKEAIKKSLEEADKGELIPHEQVMNEIKERYNLNP